MLNQLATDRILFLDIETVPGVPDFNQMSDKMKILWEKKSRRLQTEEGETADVLYNRAGIFAEFGKIVCISCGCFSGKEFRVKSFFGDDEKILLQEFADMLRRYYDNKDSLLCAHNGKEFDFPYIARRMLVLGVELPSILDMAGKKPWEVQHLDTMELWKFGDYKHYTSLELLAAIFDIPTPKDDIDGSMVGKVYWEEKNLERIVTYCQKDVITIARLLRRYQGLDLIKDEDIVLT
ncbi:MAG: 3'-5' exonuclease [Bacteroidetes bacterium GWF2_41_31]|nr:3'-5' exonuclease [Bacteroidota bacterium]OFY49249.1 MAG: 3'-5' exonuclease [Bacteroidetes bacterium GWF2_41_31]